MVGDQLANEDKVLIGDHAVAVAQRLVHAPHGSSDRNGTQGGGSRFFAGDSRQAALPRRSNQFMQICRRDTDEKLQEAVLALPAGLLARYLHLTD